MVLFVGFLFNLPYQAGPETCHVKLQTAMAKGKNTFGLLRAEQLPLSFGSLNEFGGLSWSSEFMSYPFISCHIVLMSPKSVLSQPLTLHQIHPHSLAVLKAANLPMCSRNNRKWHGTCTC